MRPGSWLFCSQYDRNDWLYTVRHLEDFPNEELLNMIDLAYDTVLLKFSQKEQRRILEET